MTTISEAAPPDHLPPSAWALGWTCLAGQLVALAARGTSRSDATWVFLSMLLSAAVVAWVSAGVLRARTGRLVVAWILFGLEIVLSVAGIVAGWRPAGWDALALTAAVGQALALGAFCRTDYVLRLRREREQGRTPVTVAPPSIAGLVLVAALVGALGGVTAPATGPNPPHQLRVGL